jgi:PHD/YefM family antitoxin component YafN of YafNO toxin-antitoxin module
MGNDRAKYQEITSRNAGKRLDELIDRVNREDTPVLIRSRKGNQAALISLDEFQFLEDLLDEIPGPEAEEFGDDLNLNGARQRLSAIPAALSENYTTVYQFKIVIEGIRPPIWRRIQVPATYTFWDLHVAIQDAMGWLDYHLHDFSVRDAKSGKMRVIGTPREEGFLDDDPILIGWVEPIRKFFPKAEIDAHYRYDFGDNWQHTVRLEKILPRDRKVAYPACLAGKRACPPEDCGGVWGYQEILEILADPDAGVHLEQRDWIREDFDPEHFDAAAVYFHDPRKRWAEAFGHSDQLNEGEEEEATTDLLMVLRRKHLHVIWEKAKTGDIEDLPFDDQRIALIMQEHRDEFFNQFEFADLTYDHEYNPDSEVNPFLHIAIHTIVETQLENRDPPEVVQFYNAMRKKKYSHHDAIHLVGSILAPMIFGVLQKGSNFNGELYAALLKKYKNRRPEKIMNLLEDEPLLKDVFP